jgi:8-oxo-dGTP pyrophosphatase MutT (NUDIX family)
MSSTNRREFGYMGHIRLCNRHDMTQFRPWWIGDALVGYLRPRFAGRLLEFGNVFSQGPGGGVRVHPALASFSDRTEAVAAVLDILWAGGEAGRQREEYYGVVTTIGAPPLMAIDRGAVTHFGVISGGFHLNGIVRGHDRDHMWVARRAKTKSTYPDMLDNMVAGGHPIGLTAQENLRKECFEEAGIPTSLADQAVAVGISSYTMEVDEGLRRHAFFIYDLDVPSEFRPQPVDGEVAEFNLMAVDQVAAIVRQGQAFKFNCNLVLIDYFVRTGMITPDDADYFRIVTGLHPVLP